MTTDIEKQFFDTFGIVPHYYCADEYVFEAMLEYECTEGNREKCKTCKKVGKSYPQITDRILLELICIVHNSYMVTGDSIEVLKRRALKACMKFKDEKGTTDQTIKQQVQALFKEG